MIWLAAFLLILLALVLAYALVWHRYPLRSELYPWRERRQHKSVDQLTQDLLERMTLQEKVAQLSGDGGPQFLLRLGINVLLMGRFPNTYSGLNERLRIPPFSFSDGPRGVVIGRATCFPVAIARAASWDTQLEQRVGDAIGQEVRAVGANYFGGLCINLLRHPAWGRAQECYGEDPVLTGTMGVALLQSVQRHHVMVCAKHFAANSIENSRFYVDTRVDRRSLHEVYLPHFKRCVDAGVASLMSAYNKVNGEYCGHSDYLLNEVLRKQWGFKGFVTSDWLWGIHETRAPALAGMDVEMPYARHYGRKLVSAVQRGEVSQLAVDRNARRVIRTKLDFISRVDTQAYDQKLLACEAHRQLAREVAEKSMVLLKNEGACLPLDKKRVKTIAVIGELAKAKNIGDHGSSRVSPPYVVTLLDGLRQYVKREGAAIDIRFHNGKDSRGAVALAQEAEVVILVAGYRHNDEGENLASNHKPGGHHKPAIGGDRPSLSLHSRDIDLIQAVATANANILVTLVGGSAIITSEWDQQVRAILMAWYPGMEGGHAFARLLFGDVNPSGKLPVSIPAKASDLVPFAPFAESADYGYCHGYTYLDQQRIQAAWPFGFGLSYTRFNYLMLSLDQQEWRSDAQGDDRYLTVGVQIRNNGDRSGEEVVQCYVGFDRVGEKTGIDRHPKLLRAFRKISLAAGEEASLSFELSLDDLKRYDPATSSWVLDCGEYRIMAGSSSRADDLLQEIVTVV